MNRITAIALFALATLTTSTSATAQRNVMDVNVPFNFTVNGTFLAAGTYTFGFDSTVSQVPCSSFETGRWRRRLAEGPWLSAVHDQPREAPHADLLHHYGSQYFLSEVRF